MEAGSIIRDLAVVLVCAAFVTVVFRALRLPVLLGYLLAGLLVGPNFLPHSPIKGLETIKDLSDLGVAFLMFYIGLEFDLKKIQRIFGSAFMGVALQTIFMIFVGVLSAPLLGWKSLDGLFLGGLLAISSTMITIPILQSQDAMKANFAQVAIGMLILEDILAIIILVIFTGVGVTGQFHWGKAWQNVFLVGVFIVVVYSIGKLVAPYLLKALKKFGTSEMITVVSVALLLGIGELAEQFHFSIALGAFLAGSILSQSALAHEIEKAIDPLKDLFTAVFFVTVGMRIEPNLLLHYWLSITLLTLVVVIGKILVVWLGLFLSGQKSRTSFKAAVCKAQIGEFSFVIAALGAQYSLTDPGLGTIAVGVALGTILLVYPLSKNVVPIYDYISSKIPDKVKELGSLYTNYNVTIREQLSKSAFLMLLKRPALQILVNFLLFNGVLIGAYLAQIHIENFEWLIEYETVLVYTIWIIGAICCLPFLISIVRNLEVIVLLITESAFSLKTSRIFKRGRMRNILNTVLVYLVLVFFGGFYLTVASPFLPSGVALIAFIGFVTLLGLLFWRYVVKVNSRLEQLFIESIASEVQITQDGRRDEAMKVFSKKHPWKIKLHDVEIKPNTLACGKKIRNLNLREKTNVTIVGISRGHYTIYDPEPEVPVFPGDHLILIGSDQEIEAAKRILTSAADKSDREMLGGKFEIDSIYLGSFSPIVGNTLSDANLRKTYKVNVIGIQRGELRLSAPKPEEILKAHDILIVVAGKKTIANFREAMDVKTAVIE